jgi:cell division protease FtsH
MEGRDVPPPMGWSKPGNGKADASPPLPPIGGPAVQS